MTKKLILPVRPRRNRRTNLIRNAFAETTLSTDNIFYPVFLTSKKNGKSEISSMPGQFRHSLESLYQLIDKALNLNIKAFALFPVIEDENKSQSAKEALNSKGLIPSALKKLTQKFPEALFISDLALDPFTTHGHDGIVKDGVILNDETVAILGEMAVLHAASGAGWVAPSDMMDGRVGKIREYLDHSGFIETSIMSYAAKYASSFYGPFRDALDSAPKSGDKKTYQMDFRNSREALREVLLDEREGADVVMVKPALSYLDIIQKVRSAVQIPVAAYNVSGEYAMIKFAAKAKAIDETAVMMESMYAIRRAGADVIFTYFALEIAQFLKRQS